MLKKCLRKFIQKNNKYCYCATNKDKVIGFILASTYQKSRNKSGFADELFVIKKFQNKGIGTKLLKKIETQFKKEKINHITSPNKIKSIQILQKKRNLKKNYFFFTFEIDSKALRISSGIAKITVLL
ncbi:MAG: hypothetical protein COV47_02750 [Candidatus Diapherotrites archaeon CG11_big_fil_rev_8_21_14_0_20_37_9]|nr:MAG: hypothetical protein COV47_02750 [Candidatus Diapherotrites archaeon CG11_big_fil_rev_8_21_14_0_20_37_9]